MPTVGQPRLLVEERRRKILDLVEKQARVTVDELVKRFGVSAVTVRGDLDALSQSGAVIRSHGGALKRVGALQDVPINVKETLHHGEKVRIGHAAAQMIRDNEIVMLDSGTTTAEVARHIKFLKLKALTVITNALNIAMELANLPHLRVIMIGGILRQMSYSLVGPHAEHTLKGLNAMMIRVAREVIVVADSSKFARRNLSLIAPLDSVHKIITDDGLAPAMVAGLRARGLEVILV